MGAREELAAIRERVLDATSLPWLEVATLHPDGRMAYGVTGEAEDDVCEMPYTPQGSEDARFVAAARTDVPRLVKALDGVLRLHTRGPDSSRGVVCFECAPEPYPCPTVRAIEAALTTDTKEAPMTDTTTEVARVLGEHRIECTGLEGVTCRGCRERGWMRWYEFERHQAAALAEAGLLRDDTKGEPR